MGTLVAEFVVLGVARPAGSKDPFFNKQTGKMFVKDSSGLPGTLWRSDVQAAAFPHFPEMLAGAVAVDVTFYRHRNKGHFGTGRNARCVKDSAPAHPITAPDGDKLARAILDALTGIAWRDDAQVVDLLARKRYGERDEARIRVSTCDAQLAGDLALGERLPFDALAA